MAGMARQCYVMRPPENRGQGELFSFELPCAVGRLLVTWEISTLDSGSGQLHFSF